MDCIVDWCWAGHFGTHDKDMGTALGIILSNSCNLHKKTTHFYGHDCNFLECPPNFHEISQNV